MGGDILNYTTEEPPSQQITFVLTKFIDYNR